ncbi:MAG: hypothetical protein ABEJ03_00330 [Candidatus Nanohaloarchaea archaeon]
MGDPYSHGDDGGGFLEKLDHSKLIDILSIGVYAYFGFVSYTNLGYNKSELTTVSMDPTVIAVQLAGFLVVLNFLMMIHDWARG